MKIACVGYLLVMLNSLDIFVSYGDDIVSSCNLRSFVTDMFFEWYAHIYFVKFFFFFFMLLAFDEIKMNIAILYLSHPLTYVQNFTEIVPREPVRRGR